ncbi:MAG: PLP-dependent aminotransferase family protein [Lentisphaeria bacterium]
MDPQPSPRRHRLARRLRTLPRSCVRDAMNAAAGDVISFAGGLPLPALFPVAPLAESADRVLRDHGAQALQYGSTEGIAPLREYVAERFLRARGIAATAADVLITSGSQQGLDLLGKVLLDPGSPLLVEAPTYMAAMQAFGLQQPRFLAVPLTADGADPVRLAALARRHRPRFFYAVPTFQNPSGVTYRPAVREAVAGALAQTRTLLVEDDPYSELYYDQPPPPPITALAGGGVMMGTFSKLLAPGLRLGWLLAPPELMEPLVRAKQATDLCTAAFTQHLLWDFLEHHDLAAHVHGLRTRYRGQRDAMLECLAAEMPADCRWTRPGGGMFVWLTAPEHVSTQALLAPCLKRGVVFAPGRSFYPGGAPDNRLRLNFTRPAPEEMRRGLRILAEEMRLAAGSGQK